MKKVSQKMISILISIVLLITITAPVTTAFAASPIKALDSKNVKLTFAAWGDPQVSAMIKDREPHLIAASNDLKNNAQMTINALVLAGDITENNTQGEYDAVYNDIAGCGVKNYITATGNHDIRGSGTIAEKRKKFVDFTNKLNKSAGSSLKIDSLYYSYTLNGYKFIVLGSDKVLPEEAEFSNKQLDWLKSELAASANKGKPVFVVVHQTLKNTHGLPGTWNSPINEAGSIGKQSDTIKNILNKYKNIVLITGHLHTGFGKYSYQKVGNIHSVNLPTLGVGNDDGSYNEDGIGYMTEVYSDKVVFRARNFEKGVYVPDYNITIKLDRVKTVKMTSSYMYDGKVKKPSVTLYDYNNKKISSSNYTVSYAKGRKNVGKYSVKITFKGAYKGHSAITKTFTIKPKSTTLSSVKAGKKSLTAKWKKQTTQTTGYQLQYSTDKNFKKNNKTVTVSKNKTTSKKISKLKSKKKYYVRIRTYKTVGKTKYYSSWSKSKSVTVK